MAKHEKDKLDESFRQLYGVMLESERLGIKQVAGWRYIKSGCWLYNPKKQEFDGEVQDSIQ